MWSPHPVRSGLLPWRMQGLRRGWARSAQDPPPATRWYSGTFEDRLPLRAWDALCIFHKRQSAVAAPPGRAPCRLGRWVTLPT